MTRAWHDRQRSRVSGVQGTTRYRARSVGGGTPAKGPLDRYRARIVGGRSALSRAPPNSAQETQMGPASIQLHRSIRSTAQARHKPP
jgi:hypothetical protein